MRALFAISFVLGCAAACVSRPAPPDAAATPPDASRPAGPQAAPTVDPQLEMATALHEPCPAAEQGARAADDALDADPGSAAKLYRLGQWLQLRDAHCFSEPAPARHAASAAAAFAAALELDPTRAEYVIALAQARPDDPRASTALDALLLRDPLNGAARLLKARRSGTKPEEAIALLSEKAVRCVAGMFLELGDLQRGLQHFEAARDAYQSELTRTCEPLGVTWHGEELSRRGAARLGLVTASLKLGDPETARRQLAWLHWDAVDAALPLVDPEVEDELWGTVEKAKLPALPKGPAPTAKDAILRLEPAATRGDWARFKALLVDENDLDRAFPACAQYGDDTGPRGTYALCIFRELLPEDSRVEGCEEQGKASAICTVVGSDASAKWKVFATRSGPGWRVASSKKP
ncbi:MAG: hypothetical protein QM765_41500 [Myxococcales bacterium]